MLAGREMSPLLHQKPSKPLLSSRGGTRRCCRGISATLLLDLAFKGPPLTPTGELPRGLNPDASETQRAAPGSKSKRRGGTEPTVHCVARKQRAKEKERDTRASFKRSVALCKSHAEQLVLKTVASTTSKHRGAFLGAFISGTQTGASTRLLCEGKRLTHSSRDAQEQDMVLWSFGSHITRLGHPACTHAPANPWTRWVPG